MSARDAVDDWPDDAASIRMAGPAAFVFEGEWG